MRIDRRRYAELYGPTVGDRVRLGDTDLWISPTEDRCCPAGPCDETVFGGGKVIRESMGQATFSTVDLVITNAVVLDHWGVVKADVGVRNGRITAVGQVGRGNRVSREEPAARAGGGGAGYKPHEDGGSPPAAIDACLRAADRHGVQVAIHTDTLNEAGFVADTLAAIGGRSIHAYHTEGAGGGHAPDIITVASAPNVLPSSTNPTRPHTTNTIDEHLDMLMVCHHLNPKVAEDLAFAESRIRPSTIAAEDWLHDLGAISMIGSDSQAMGRIGEVATRTWQTAHVMKQRAGALAGEPVAGADNLRAQRYVAKITVCPAVAHGLAGEIGSIEPGKLADLVLWDPGWFGIRPEVVVKGGLVARAQMGDANASIPTPQPILSRPMFGDTAAGAPSVAWVAPAALEDGLADRLGLSRRLLPVANTRRLTKADLPQNTATPLIEVDP